MRFLIKEGDTKFRLATAEETHDSVQRCFQRKENGYIRAVPGFHIEGNVKKDVIYPKNKTMLGKMKGDTGKDGKRKVDTRKDGKRKVDTGKDGVRRSERIKSNR